MYQDATERLLNHSEGCQVYKVASLLTDALSQTLAKTTMNRQRTVIQTNFAELLFSEVCIQDLA
jgi:hypothetical protein